jgi:hypothetical protein
LSGNRSQTTVDRERKTLAEFSRIYLRSLETPAIVETALDEDNGERGFAACVVLGMKRAKLVPEPRNR